MPRVMILLCLLMLPVLSAEKLSLYMQNKHAIECTAKMYLAFEARNAIGPGVDEDLNLPEKAKFRIHEKTTFENWIYPIAIGLEIKIGTPQQIVIVMAPKPINGKYWIATEDLTIKAYTKKEIAPILHALEKRRKQLRNSLLKPSF